MFGSYLQSLGGGWISLRTQFLSNCLKGYPLQYGLENPLDCKEIQSVHSEGDQPWDFFGGNDAKAETPVLWPPHEKSWLIEKDSDARRDWGQEEKTTTEDEVAGWHHRLDGRGFDWTLGVGDGQGGLVCCNSWSCKESDTTERLIWSDLITCTGSAFNDKPSQVFLPGEFHGQRRLAGYSPWGHKESDVIEAT